MKAFTVFVLVLWVLPIVGCGATRSLQRQSAPTTETTETAGRVAVAMYRQSPMLVAIPMRGSTLRSVIADAKDLISQRGTISDAFVFNDVSTFAGESGLLERDISEALAQSSLETPIYAGAEVVVLQRQNLLLFIPGFMVLDTAAGSFHVMPGDRVMTLPLSAITDLAEEPQSLSVADGSTIPVNYGRILVTIDSDYFAAMQVGINSGTTPPTVEKLLSFDNWKTSLGITESIPKFDLRQVHPNAVVLVRQSSDGIMRLAVLPGSVTLDIDQVASGQQQLLVNDFGDGVDVGKFLAVTLRNGDHLSVTRLERIPFITAGMPASGIQDSLLLQRR